MPTVNRPATIRDVARASGVSASTVSCVLNQGSRSVRPETRARIEAAMERLHFHPSTVARGLARRRLDCLGIVLPHPKASLVVDPYFSGVLDGIFQVATQRRQNVMVYTGLEWRDASRSLPAFRDRRADGLLLLATQTGSDIVPALTGAGLPFVMVSGTSPDPQVASVDIDNAAGARQAVGHLLALGHRRIALLGGQPTSPSSARRAQGYRQALTDAGLRPDPMLIHSGEYNSAWGYGGMQRLLALPEPPTAVFAGSDMIAVGVYRACTEAGISVPEQISVVGFDDTALAVHLAPPLTTVRQPLTQLGAVGATLLLDRLDVGAADTMPTQVILPTELIVRASTGPLRSRPLHRSKEKSVDL